MRNLPGDPSCSRVRDGCTCTVHVAGEAVHAALARIVDEVLDKDAPPGG